MGKNDKKTRKGKINRGSYGNTRPRNEAKAARPDAAQKQGAAAGGAKK